MEVFKNTLLKDLFEDLGFSTETTRIEWFMVDQQLRSVVIRLLQSYEVP